jgi:hypothetical protein
MYGKNHLMEEPQVNWTLEITKRSSNDKWYGLNTYTSAGPRVTPRTFVKGPMENLHKKAP